MATPKKKTRAKKAPTKGRSNKWIKARESALQRLEDQHLEQSLIVNPTNEQMSALYRLEARMWSIRAELSTNEGKWERAAKEMVSSNAREKLAAKVAADKLTERLAELEARIEATDRTRGLLADLDNM